MELIAFTNDEAYWERLLADAAGTTCPRTFHGLVARCRSDFRTGQRSGAVAAGRRIRGYSVLARYDVGMSVMHPLAAALLRRGIAAAQANAYANLGDLLALAAERGVNMAIKEPRQTNRADLTFVYE